MSMNIDKIIELDSPRFSVKFYEDDLIIDDRLKECHVYAVRYGNFVEGRASSVEERYLDKNGRLCHSSTDDKPALLVRGSYHFFLSKIALDDPAAEIKEEHCIELVRIQSANQTIKFDVKSEIRSEDGGEPVLVLAEDKTLKNKGVPIGLGGGSFEWEAEGFIEIDGANNEEIVKIKPKVPEKKKGKELKEKSKLTLKYKIDEESEAFAKAEVEITVIGGLKLNLFPRKLKWNDKPMLFEKENDDNGRVKIKEILPKFLSKALPDEQKSNDSFENLKEVEYNYYIDFAELKTYASGEKNYYCEKEVVFYFEYGKIVGLEDSEKKEKQLWAAYNKKNIKFKLTRTDEESDLRFVEEKDKKKKLIKEQELIPDDKGLFCLKLAYPLQEVASDARELRIKLEMVADSNTFQELTLNLTRNSHVSEELVEVIGDRNDPNGARGFLVVNLPGMDWMGKEKHLLPEKVDGKNDKFNFAYDTRYATESDGVKRFQKLLIYDLDRRDDSSVEAGQNRNRVDGKFTGITAYYLTELIEIMQNKNYLKQEHLLSKTGIDSKDNKYANPDNPEYIGLEQYLKEEYDYKYKTGEIIDRQLLIGNVNDSNTIDQIDGLLEILEYNENNISNLTSNAILGHTSNAGFIDSFDNLSSATGAWFEITNPRQSTPQYHDNDKPWDGWLLRHHEGFDRKSTNGGIYAPIFFRCRATPGSSYNNPSGYKSFWPEFEVIGMSRTIRLLHLDLDPKVKEKNLYYPNEMITNYPRGYTDTNGNVKGDGGTGIHVHFERWQIRKSSQSILRCCDTDTAAAEGTVFYLKKYRKITSFTEEQQEYIDALPVNRRTIEWYYRYFNAPNIHTQPGSPFDE